MARPKPALIVTDMERQALESMAHRSRTTPQLARRARIVLACASGLDNTTVARKLRMCQPTVGRWRQRFIIQRLDGLLDEPRPGTPRTITDTQVEEIVVRTLESAPVGATHWSTRSLSKAAGISPMSVHRIWQAFGLQPHRTKTFKLSPDPLLVDKIRDIVGLYLNPPEHAAVFWVDEKPQIRSRAEPEFPAAARVDAGRVVLRLYIAETGEVDEIAVVQAGPDAAFEEPAVRAFAGALFTPGRRRGVAVKSMVTIEVLFGIPLPLTQAKPPEGPLFQPPSRGRATPGTTATRRENQ